MYIYQFTILIFSSLFMYSNARYQLNSPVGCNMIACDMITQQLLDYLSDIKNNQQNNTSILNQIQQTVSNNCMYTPITNKSTVISQPGSYCLNQDLQGPITINSSNVVINLNAHRIMGGTQGIVIAPNFNNIYITNGYINNIQDEAVLLSGTNNNIVIDTIVMSNCSNNSLYQIRTVDAGIVNNNIKISNCLVNGGSGFLVFNRVSDSSITDNTINGANQSQGLGVITLHNTNQVSLKNNVIQDIDVNQITTIGVYSAGQTVIDYCIVRSIAAQAGLTGIYVDNNSTDCVIKNCIVQNLSSTQGGVFGIFVNNTTLMNNIIIDLISTTTGSCVGIRSVGEVNIQECLVSKLNSQQGLTGISLVGDGIIQNCTINNLNNNEYYSPFQSCFGIQSTGDLDINNCLVSDINSSNDFIGIQLNGNVSIKNSTIKNLAYTNASNQFCFAIQSTSGNLAIDNCLIYDINTLSDFTAIEANCPSIIRNSVINTINSSGLYSAGSLNNGLIGMYITTDSYIENCIVKDINLTNTKSGYASAFILTGTNIIVDNCSVFDITSSSYAYGMCAKNITYACVSRTCIDNIISSAQSHGIDIIMSSSLTVNACSINNVQGINTGTLLISGIYCQESSWGSVINNNITNINAIDPQDNGSNAFGIGLTYNTDNMTLQRNTINNIQGYGISAQILNSIITNNTVTNCKNAGIDDNGSTGNFIAFNNSFNNQPNYDLKGTDSGNYVVLVESTQFIYGANIANY